MWFNSPFTITFLRLPTTYFSSESQTHSDMCAHCSILPLEMGQLCILRNVVVNVIIACDTVTGGTDMH